MNTSDELSFWLALARAPTIGAVRFARLLQQFGTPSKVFNAPTVILNTLGISREAVEYLQSPDWSLIENDLQWLEKPGNSLLTLHDPDYPILLRQIHDPPPLLFVHGEVGLLTSHQIAIVGTRHPSRSGAEIAFEFAKHLTLAGFTVTSGLALGIDGAGHQGALAGTGRTIAVVGTGVDRVYPRQHHELAHQIAKTGAILSELPPGTTPSPMNFPRRNRIISGLSLGVLVVEAPVNSGALITAKLAIEQGREVFAIPGSIHNPLARGCHALIKQGAKLIETTADVIEEFVLQANLNPKSMITSLELSPLGAQTDCGDLDADYLRLLEYMRGEPTSIDNLVELSGLTAEAVSSMLLILELRGVVAAQSGGLYSRLR